MTTKLKKLNWHQRDRASRLANVMFPHLADKETQTEMQGYADRERKRLSYPTLLNNHHRGCVSPLGGAAQPRRK
jgi:hypothetical protein